MPNDAHTPPFNSRGGLEFVTIPNAEEQGLAAWRGQTLWAAALFAATLGFARLSYGMLLPALRNTFGGSLDIYGLIGTLNFAGYLLGTLAVPPLVARIPHRSQLNLLAGLALGLSIAASALSSGLLVLGAWRMLIGVLSALVTVLTLALTLDTTRPDDRGLAAGIVWAGGAGGIAVSGLVVPLVLAGPPAGWRWTWLGMGGLGLLAALGFARAGRRVPPRQEAQPSSLPALRPASRTPVWPIVRSLAQPRGLLWLGLAYLGFGAGYIIYFTYLIAALRERGVPPTNVGWIWSALGATGMVSGVLWGRAIDRWPSGWTLATALLLGAGGAALVLHPNLVIVGGGAALVGFAAFIGPPLLVTALLRRAVPADAYATCFSILTALFASGQIGGPLLGAHIGAQLGLAAGVATSAALLGLSALCAAAYGVIQRQASQPDKVALKT